MVTEYSLATDGEKKITPNFRVKEFACHDGSDVVLMDTATVEILENVRSYYRNTNPKATVVVISGYRTAKHNRRVGGAKFSQHVQGRACDFIVRIPGKGIVPPRDVYAALNNVAILGHSHKGGLGRYSSFTHVDTASKRRWHG